MARARPSGIESKFRKALSSFVQRMASTSDIEALLRDAFEVVHGVIKADAMFVATLTGDRSYLKLLETDLDDLGNRVFCAPQPIDPNSSTVLEGLHQHRFVLINRTAEELRRLAKGFHEVGDWAPVGNPKRRSASLLFVPIWHGAQYAGAMSVQSYDRNAYDREDAERMVVLADYIGLAIRHSRLVDAGRRARRGNL
jgi:transcriptional regulator with GAF, ATPase, and Fis domain